LPDSAVKHKHRFCSYTLIKQVCVSINLIMLSGAKTGGRQMTEQQ